MNSEKINSIRQKERLIKSYSTILWAIFFLSFTLFNSNFTKAQTVSATLNADSNHILIGDFLQIKYNLRCATTTQIKLPALSDTIGNMEIIKASKIDTLIEGDTKQFSQTYTVSAYDSGIFHAGPQKILFKTKDGIIDSAFSNVLLIKVATVPVDTSKTFKAIKAPIDLPYTWQEFIPLIGGGILLLAIIVALIFYLRHLRKNRKPKIVERPKPKDPAHVWARKELKKLEEAKLWQKDEVKLYYSRLTDILRMYLEYRFNWLALESTTSEIAAEIDAYNVSDEGKEKLLIILRNADMVKFAKLLPLPDANSNAMDGAYRFIDLTEQKEIKTEDKINTK